MFPLHLQAGLDGPSSNVSSGNNYGGSHLEWRPRVPAGSSISKQFDCRSTSKSPCQENPSFPGTKDEVSSDLGKLKLVESSPEAVTPKMEPVYCMSISVASSALEKGFPSIDLSDKDLSIQRTQQGKIPGAEVESDSTLRVDGSPALDTAHLGNEQSPHKKAIDSGSSNIPGSLAVRVPYDICLVRAENSVTLKTPLHVQNRAKRNEAKRSMEGTCINVLRPGMILLKSYIPIKDQVILCAHLFPLNMVLHFAVPDWSIKTAKLKSTTHVYILTVVYGVQTNARPLSRIYAITDNMLLS